MFNWKDQEGIGRGQSWQIPEETDRNHKKTQCNRCYTRDLKNEPLELKPDTLPLRQLVTLLLLVVVVVVVVGHHRHSHLLKHRFRCSHSIQNLCVQPKKKVTISRPLTKRECRI